MIVDDVAGVVVGVVVVMSALRMWPDDAVAFRGFLWIRPPAMRIHSPVRTPL